MDSLLKVEDIDAVIINTDAREILAENGLADGYADGRVIIRDRKAEICGDFVSMNLVLADDIAAIEADSYVMTHTTNPLLSSATIAEALRQYQAKAKNGEDQPQWDQAEAVALYGRNKA